MADAGKILIEEHNIISLRTACVLDIDGSVSLQLLPSQSSTAVTRPNVYKSEFIEWLRRYQVFLYENNPSASSFPIRNARQFEKSPELKLLWTDSGNSVAVYLNGEPWAFIDENTQRAYSKRIIPSRLGSPWDSMIKAQNPGNSWNQEVFNKTFAGAL